MRFASATRTIPATWPWRLSGCSREKACLWCRVRGLLGIAALGALEVHRRWRPPAGLTFHRAGLSLMVRDEVFQRGQQERLELAAARVADPDGAFLQELDEERLGEIPGVLSGVSQASKVGIERVPVGPAQRRERLFGVQ